MKKEKVKIWMLKLKEMMEDINTSLLTEKDYFYLVNSKLPKEDNISMSYFEALKSPNQNNKRSISSLEYLTDEEKEEFLNILNTGRAEQKVRLTERMFDDKKRNSYPYIWAIERKNTDLQLKQNLQIGNGNITLQIEGVDAKVIDSIDVDYIDFEEVKPLLITKKDNEDEK